MAVDWLVVFRDLARDYPGISRQHSLRAKVRALKAAVHTDGERADVIARVPDEGRETMRAWLEASADAPLSSKMGA